MILRRLEGLTEMQYYLSSVEQLSEVIKAT